MSEFPSDVESQCGRKKKKETIAQQAVASIKLRQIEREHRSIGSILDKRTLHPIEEPAQFQRSRSLEKHEQKSSILEEEKPKDEDDIFKYNFRNDEFREEEMIWKSKARAPNYIMKRRFEDPNLHRFKNTMSNLQKKKYQRRSKEALYSLSQTLRDDITAAKHDMDERGVFHPEANAQRAHSLYLLKLYRGIAAETIEDPVLRKLKDEDRGGGQSNSKRDESIKDLKSVDSFVVKLSRKLNDSLTNLDKLQEQNTATSSLSKTSTKEADNRRLVKKGDVSSGSAAASKHSVSGLDSLELSRPSIPPEEDSNRVGIDRRESRERIQFNLVGAKDKDGEKGSMKPVSQITQRDLSVSKFLKAAGSDPRKVLVEEAERLDSAPKTSKKKDLSKTDFIDKEATTWMLASVHKDQITQASGGYAFNLPSWRTIPGLIPSIDNLDSEDSMDGNSQVFGRKYSDRSLNTNQTSSTHDTLTGSAVMPPFASPGVGPPRGFTPSGRRSSPSMTKLEAPTPVDVLSFQEFQDTFNDFVNRELSRHSNRQTSSQSISGDTESPLERHPSIEKHPNLSRSTQDDRVAISSLQQAALSDAYGNNSSGPTNVVKVLAKIDPQFKEFLKLSKSDSLKGKRTHHSSHHRISREEGGDQGQYTSSRVRPIPLLGKKAVTLGQERDIRGNLTGVRNVFSSKSTATRSTPQPSVTMNEEDHNSEKTSSESGTMSEALDIQQEVNNALAEIKDMNVQETKGPLLADTEFPIFPKPRTPEVKDRVRYSPQAFTYIAHSRSSSPHSTTSSNGGLDDTRLLRSPGSPSMGSPTARSSRGTGTAGTGTSGGSSRRKRREKMNRRGAKSPNDNQNRQPPTVQEKLTSIWGTLQTSTMAKVAFMRKYSDSNYAGDLVAAMDRWGEVACLMAFRKMIQRFATEKKQGFYCGAMYYKDFKKNIMTGVPSVFLSTATELVPRTRTDDSEAMLDFDTKPLSLTAASNIVVFVKRVFMDRKATNSDKDNLFVDESSLNLVVVEVAKKIDVMLLAAVKLAKELLGDNVSCEGATALEWLMSLGRQLTTLEVTDPTTDYVSHMLKKTSSADLAEEDIFE